MSVTTAADRPKRTTDDLRPDERQRLERAHRRLRDAVKAGEQFLGGPLEPGKEVPVHDARAMAEVYAEVDAAETELWRLREELLGWPRPASVPPANLVADWFSDEDRVYDDVEAGSSS